ncbi:MAG: PEP-CTERM sorting domain-containing protein [Bryobacterales bacterium]|nr:PEP-CTERM sorting domain-containing protein [Bryobacterales bacterium]
MTIPGLQAPGPYLGVFTILGGADEFALDVIGTGSFQVDVTSSSQDVPEPATFLLIGGGVGLLAWGRRP